MNWIVFHITSGGVFLSGSFCVVLATFFGIWKKTRFRAFSPLLALLDLLLIVVSATPFPYWYYGLVVVVMGIWLFTVRSEKVEEKRRRVISSVAMTVILLGVVWELPWQITPRLIHRPMSHSRFMQIPLLPVWVRTKGSLGLKYLNAQSTRRFSTGHVLEQPLVLH